MASTCTLDPARRESRLREWQALRTAALISETHSEAGSVSVFEGGPEVRRRIDAQIQAEHDCCSHLEFAVTEGGDRITVEVTAPGDAG